MKNLKFILFAIVHLVFLAHSARAYYDPATGQFLSREPLGENESLNLYTYGHNDPVNNVDVLGLQAVSVTSQEMSDTLRSRWLLELVASGLQHPESPTADQTRTYANYFGLTKPFTDADYDRAASLAGGLMVNHGRPSARTPSWEETELAKQPGMMPYVAPPAVQTAALSIGAPSSSAFYADMNAAFLLPIGAEGFIFSGALSGLRVGGIMATGASFERAMLLNGITSELRTGAMLAGGSMSKTPLLFGQLTVAGVAENEGVTLFRGTSAGYPGSPGLQRIGITPASTDPAISTLFAIESANYGVGVVHIASPQALIGVTVGPGNVLAAIEREVAVELLPAQFAARSQTITAAQSRSILEGMGIRTPATIADKAALDAALRASTPMTPAQIHAYLKAARP